MPLLLLFVLASAVAATVGFAVWRYPRMGRPSAGPAVETARQVGKAVGKHPRLRAARAARLDPSVATGLALTVALVLAIGGGLLLGILAYLVRTNSFLTGIDNGVAKWGHRHGSPTSMHVLNDITQLGSIYTVVALCVILAATETIRERSVWVVPFIVAVMGGEELLTLTVKQLADRVRPAFNPAAATLGPSFPSGHSATAAAFYATAALLLGRWRTRPVRATVSGLAAGIAVAVAASRVLLDVHWLSDVIAGLALGWAWFAVCGIAFGGRILRFGAGAETAARASDAVAAAPEGVADVSVRAARKARSSVRKSDHTGGNMTGNSGRLAGKTIAIIATDMVEEVELVEPRRALEDAGATTELVSLEHGEIQGYNHFDKADRLPVDRTVDEVDASQYDGLLIPGGVGNPDRLRSDERMVSFTRAFFEQGKPVAAICHGPWMLVEADVVRGRRVTSWPSLKTDLRNAGAEWVDKEVVVDSGLVTSRKPDDIPSFSRKMIEEFAEGRHQGQRQAAAAAASR